MSKNTVDLLYSEKKSKKYNLKLGGDDGILEAEIKSKKRNEAQNIENDRNQNSDNVSYI